MPQFNTLARIGCESIETSLRKPAFGQGHSIAVKRQAATKAVDDGSQAGRWDHKGSGQGRPQIQWLSCLKFRLPKVWSLHRFGSSQDPP